MIISGFLRVHGFYKHTLKYLHIERYDVWDLFQTNIGGLQQVGIWVKQD